MKPLKISQVFSSPYKFTLTRTHVINMWLRSMMDPRQSLGVDSTHLSSVKMKLETREVSIDSTSLLIQSRIFAFIMVNSANRRMPQKMGL